MQNLFIFKTNQGVLFERNYKALMSWYFYPVHFIDILLTLKLCVFDQDIYVLLSLAFLFVMCFVNKMFNLVVWILLSCWFIRKIGVHDSQEYQFSI